MSLNIKTNASLQSLNTMAVPARASHFVKVNSIEDSLEAIGFAKQNNLSIFVLGEGSNTLFSKDYAGLVMLNQLLGVELIEENNDTVLIKVAAGENWHRLVSYTLQQGWFGLENLALIPGLVGATPIQNIGAYGVEVKNSVEAVEFIDFERAQISLLTNSQCQFAYRDSVFKHALRAKGMISAVFYRLQKTPHANLSYPALSNFLKKQPSPTPQQVFDAVCQIRSAKLPSPSVIPNLGSFFKNPIVSKAKHDQLKKQFPDLVSYPHNHRFKLAAAWLIDHADWKTKTINNISVHEQQALVIINPHKESGQKVFNFAEMIQQDIDSRFGIKLEIEPNIV